MRTAFEYYGIANKMSEVDKPILRTIKAWLDWLPDSGLGIESLLSCHVVSRLVKRKFDLTTWRVVDGCFGRHQHSWLASGLIIVLDVYPVASMGGPLLVDVEHMSPWHGLYRPDNDNGWFSKNDLKRFDLEAENFYQTIGKAEPLGLF